MNKAGMIPTVRYRLPGHTHYVHIEGRLCPLAGFHELTGREGFVMAPFAGAPLLLLPDDVREVPLPDACPAGQDVCRTPRSEDRAAYSREFRILQEALQSGRLEKVVLSRRARMATGDADAETLFLRACHVYPDCYVCLFDTPQTGCWLTASPELLLAGRGAEWETMALAGTLPVRGGDMPRAEDFGAKNLREQALVTRHILRAVRPFARELTEGAREVRRMGGIAHLSTPVRFRTEDPFTGVGLLLQQLHPTPAVCGEPQAEALEALLRLPSGRERGFYAGFTGCISPESASLYVTLRAMQLRDGYAYLYAGGGLLPESNEEAEWEETCRKMDTIQFLCTPTIKA